MSPFLHVPAAGADDKLPIVEKTGWMKKRGKTAMGSWRRRWFVLSPSEPVLAYVCAQLLGGPVADGPVFASFCCL